LIAVRWRTNANISLLYKNLYALDTLRTIYGKTRQLSIEQANALEHHDPLFIAELNRQRSEMWQEARERLKSLANHALDVVELHLGSGDPKASLATAKYTHMKRFV